MVYNAVYNNNEKLCKITKNYTIKILLFLGLIMRKTGNFKGFKKTRILRV